MSKRMLVDASHREETRVVVADGTQIDDFDFEAATKKPLRGNIYLARVTRVEPSLQAAFVEYGGNRHGFLAFSEIHPDYYQIPVADKERLKALQEEEDAKNAAADDDDGDDEDTVEAADDADMSDSDADDDASDDTQKAGTDSDDDDETSRTRALASAVPATMELEDPATDADDWDGGDDYTELEDPALDLYADDDEDDDSDDDDGDDDTAEASEAGGDDDTGGDNRRRGRSRRGRGARGRSNSNNNRRGGGGGRGRGRSRRGGDDDDEAGGRNIRPFLRNYKIQEVIKRRQVLLIQVVKEERGNKGAALTTYLSLAGRYCVLMPNTARGGGISRKITNMPDRRRLKSAVAEFDVPKGMGLIVRTAGANRTKAEIRRDYEYLTRLWESVRDLTLQSSAPSLVYEEGNLIKRSIRDLYSKDIDEVLVEGEEAYKEAKAFMRMLMPSHARNVKLYRERLPLYQRYHVDQQLDQMLSPRVDLPSGGYIIINQTEALVSIDVNSGRSTREHNIEQTALKTNLEAAAEVARQLRLRDLAGLIVIDFIDMEENRNNRAVERQMKDCLAQDRARIQVGRISNFGLLEMSRQRMRSGVLEGSTRPCPHCEGTGMVRSVESAALRVLRACEEEGARERSASITVRTNAAAATYILNHKRRLLLEFEDRYGMVVLIQGDPHAVGDDFEIERGEQLSEARKRELQTTNVVSPDAAFLQEEEEKDKAAEAEAAADLAEMEEDSEAEAEETSSGDNDESDADQNASGDDEDTGEDGTPRRRRRGRRGGRRNRRRREEAAARDGGSEDDGKGAEASADADTAGDQSKDASGEAADGEEKPRPRRRRGTRGGRGRKRQTRAKRDEDGDSGKSEGADASPAKEQSGNGSAASGSGRSNVTSEERRQPEPVGAESAPSAPRPETGSPGDGGDEKKGWWQRRWFS